MPSVPSRSLPAALLALAGSTCAVGSPFPPLFLLTTLDGANGFKAVGPGMDEYLGFAVSAAGDIDGDNDTDVFDFAEIALAFGTSPGQTNRNPDADLSPNSTIDVFEFAELAEDFGCDGD